MNRISQVVIILLFFMAPFEALAKDDASVDRSSAFVSGVADPSETFGASEGMVLLTVGLVALLVSFVLLFFAKTTQDKNESDLVAIEKQLIKGGNTDAP